jgi:hypothetical protein
LRVTARFSGFLGEEGANRAATFSANCGNADVERGKAARTPSRKRDLILRFVKEYKG